MTWHIKNALYTLCLFWMYIYAIQNLGSWFATTKKSRYQPVTDWTYRRKIFAFNNWNIITLSHKITTSEAFEDIHQVVLDGISENAASLVQYGNYGAINTTDTMRMGYYEIEFVSEAYTLQDDTTCNGKTISVGELVFKVQYLSYIQENKSGIWSRNISNKSSLFQHAILKIHVFVLCK